MFASIKPGGHFEQKRARPGKKALEKPSSESEKKKKFNARGNRARRTPRDLYATTQTPPKHRPRTFRTRSNRSRRGDFARPNNQKMLSTVYTYRLYQSPQLRARGPDVLVLLPSAAASAATTASASAASVATASASVASVAAATEAARKSASVRFFSHRFVFCFRFFSLVCVKK